MAERQVQITVLSAARPLVVLPSKVAALGALVLTAFQALLPLAETLYLAHRAAALAALAALAAPSILAALAAYLAIWRAALAA